MSNEFVDAIKRMRGAIASAPNEESKKDSIDSLFEFAELNEKFVFKQGKLPSELTHANMIALKINDEYVYSANWNKCVTIMLIEIAKGGKDILSLNEKHLNVAQGKYYKIDIPDTNKSFQGLSRKYAGPIITNLAIRFKINVELAFIWEMNKKAVHGGKLGKIVVTNP